MLDGEETLGACHYGLGTAFSSRARMKLLFALTGNRREKKIEQGSGNMEQKLSGGRISEVWMWRRMKEGKGVRLRQWWRGKGSEGLGVRGGDVCRVRKKKVRSNPGHSEWKWWIKEKERWRENGFQEEEKDKCECEKVSGLAWEGTYRGEKEAERRGRDAAEKVGRRAALPNLP